MTDWLHHVSTYTENFFQHFRCKNMRKVDTIPACVHFKTTAVLELLKSAIGPYVTFRPLYVDKVYVTSLNGLYHSDIA